MVREVRFAWLVTLVIAVLTTACGPSGGGTVEPRTYARAVCTGLESWREGVTGDSAELSRALSAGASDVTTVKARYSRFFSGAVRRTDELVRVLDRAGAPEVDGGLGYARDLRQAVLEARNGLADASARFAALPSTDLRAYAAGARKIRDSLGTQFAGVGAALDRLGTTYPDEDLTEAFRDEPDCQSLA